MRIITNEDTMLSLVVRGRARTHLLHGVYQNGGAGSMWPEAPPRHDALVPVMTAKTGKPREHTIFD